MTSRWKSSYLTENHEVHRETTVGGGIDSRIRNSVDRDQLHSNDSLYPHTKTALSYEGALANRFRSRPLARDKFDEQTGQNGESVSRFSPGRFSALLKTRSR